MVARAYPEMEAYVRQSAIRHGIDPDVAVAVAKAEALNVFDPDKPDHGGDDGSSFGLYQLHYGGMSKAMPNAGLGDEFTAKTGLDARDPSTWKQQVDFSHEWAAKNGWGSWMGAKNNGIGNWDGIRSQRRVSGPVEAAGGGAGADVGAPALYNPGPALAPATATAFSKSTDEPIALVPTRERTLADDFADAYDGSGGSRRRQDGASGGIIYSPLDQEKAPLPEFDFASANAETEGQPPAALSRPTPTLDEQSLADLFKVGDIGLAGQVDPVTGLPVLPQRRRAYG